MQNDQITEACIDWRDGDIPVATRFDDPYYSVDDGLSETRHVFLRGNRLPQRFAPGFHIAELGFGTGLNLLAAWQAWRESGQKTPLRYTGFEAFPMRPCDMEKALAPFQELEPFATELLAGWAKDRTSLHLEGLEAQIILGDARDKIHEMDARADAWFLDGFAPTRNPELWQPELLLEVAKRTRPGGTFATYCAAGHVRRSLTNAGFTVARLGGFGRKRHMTAGVSEVPQ